VISHLTVTKFYQLPEDIMRNTRKIMIFMHIGGIFCAHMRYYSRFWNHIGGFGSHNLSHRRFLELLFISYWILMVKMWTKFSENLTVDAAHRDESNKPKNIFLIKMSHRRFLWNQRRYAPLRKLLVRGYTIVILSQIISIFRYRYHPII